MIKCNLAVLLAERSMRISELSKRTGISRTTLTALAHNQSKGIQFETFDTLCTFLKIKPNDLFIQEALEYSFKVDQILENEIPTTDQTVIIIHTIIQYENRLIDMTFNCSITKSTKKYINVPYPLILVSPIYPERIKEILELIPISLKTSFEEDLLNVIKEEWANFINFDPESIEVELA